MRKRIARGEPNFFVFCGSTGPVFDSFSLFYIFFFFFFWCGRCAGTVFLIYFLFLVWGRGRWECGTLGPFFFFKGKGTRLTSDSLVLLLLGGGTIVKFFF